MSTTIFGVYDIDRKIYFDMDGVLIDFEQGADELAKELAITNLINYKVKEK